MIGPTSKDVAPSGSGGNREILFALEQAVGGLRDAQAANAANNYILFELVRDMATLSGNRHDYFSRLFERISGRADRIGLEREGSPLNAAFRMHIERFFKTLALTER